MQNINCTYRILALTLALLIFTSSVGWTIDSHYCGGELKSTSLIGKAESCHDMSTTITETTCSHHDNMMKCKGEQTLYKKDCCKNMTKRYQSNDDRNIINVELDMAKVSVQFISAFVYVFSLNHISYNGEKIGFENYISPLISKDYSVLFQSFII